MAAEHHHNNPYPTLPAANLSRFSVSPPHPAAAVEQARKTVTWSLDRHRRHHQYAAAAAASEDRKAVKIQVAGWRGTRGVGFRKTPSKGGVSFMLILYKYNNEIIIFGLGFLLSKMSSTIGKNNDCVGGIITKF